MDQEVLCSNADKIVDYLLAAANHTALAMPTMHPAFEV